MGLNLRKLYFTNNWKQPFETTLIDLKYHTPNNDAIWKDLTYTTNIDEADFFILLEGLPPELEGKIDLSRTILIRLEPPWVKPIDNKLIQSLFYNMSYDTDFGVAMWWSFTLFKDFDLMPYQKNRDTSCLISSKTMTEGHRVRLEFFKRYLQKYNNIDVFGRNLTKDIGECFKGELPREDTDLAYKNYRYSFICENGSIKNYITARFFDCILNWSFPIYWGATNVYDYFPEDSLFTFDLRTESIDKLYDLTQRPLTKRNIEALGEARQLTLHQYSVWEKIYKVIT